MLTDCHPERRPQPQRRSSRSNAVSASLPLSVIQRMLKTINRLSEPLNDTSERLNDMYNVAERPIGAAERHAQCR